MTGRSSLPRAARIFRVVVADDEPFVRHTLTDYFSTAEDLVVVGCAANGPDAVRLARDGRADVVLMDLRMPGGDGYTATQALRRALPDVRVVAITALDSREAARAAIRSGALGFLRKSAGRDVVVNTVRLVVQGHSVLPLEDFTRLMGGAGSHEIPKDATPRLTRREREVLGRLTQGMTNRQIAADLGVSESTAKMHLTAVMSKLGVTSRVQALAAAHRLGLTSSE